MKPLNEVIEEEKAELRKKWPPFEVEGDHEQYSEGIFVSDIESLEDHLTQAMKKAALAAQAELLPYLEAYKQTLERSTGDPIITQTVYISPEQSLRNAADEIERKRADAKKLGEIITTLRDQLTDKE